MKYYLIAGEASGDLHGSNLMRGIKKSDPEAEFRFFGGNLMHKQGGILVRHYKAMAFMGFFDVLANIVTILDNLAFCKKDILTFSPDAVILIDYPGFNLRIAKFAKINGFKTFYYIAPKVWVWKKSRIPKLKEYVDRIFVIFPFEVDFFRSHGIETEYFGNPLTDSIRNYRETEKETNGFITDSAIDKRKVIALLCGSRRHEVQRCLPRMVKASHSFPGYRFVVAGVSSVEESLYKKILIGTEIELLIDKTYSLLEGSFAAVVTSGTATLETAMFKVPQVVIYRIGPFTYHLARLFVNVKFFSLVNIIAGKEVVKELLQVGLPEKIKLELKRLLEDNVYRKNMIEEYDKIGIMTGGDGASEKIGSRIVEITGK